KKAELPDGTGAGGGVGGGGRSERRELVTLCGTTVARIGGTGASTGGGTCAPAGRVGRLITPVRAAAARARSLCAIRARAPSDRPGSRTSPRVSWERNH